jgi:hypothetical protein
VTGGRHHVIVVLGDGSQAWADVHDPIVPVMRGLHAAPRLEDAPQTLALLMRWLDTNSEQSRACQEQRCHHTI